MGLELCSETHTRYSRKYTCCTRVLYLCVVPNSAKVLIYFAQCHTFVCVTFKTRIKLNEIHPGFESYTHTKVLWPTEYVLVEKHRGSQVLLLEFRPSLSILWYPCSNTNFKICLVISKKLNHQNFLFDSTTFLILFCIEWECCFLLFTMLFSKSAWRGPSKTRFNIVVCVLQRCSISTTVHCTRLLNLNLVHVPRGPVRADGDLNTAAPLHSHSWR